VAFFKAFDMILPKWTIRFGEALWSKMLMSGKNKADLLISKRNRFVKAVPQFLNP
jgi:hypothetical protein